MEMKICRLYPVALGQFGDAGNMLCLRRRLEWRGIDVSVTELASAKDADLTEYDLVFIGGGMGIYAALADIETGGAAVIRAAIESGVTFLAVCEGLELLGKYRVEADGTRRECAGAVDFHVELSPDRLTGDCVFDCGGIQVVAFENHAARLIPGEEVFPLGTVVRGHGNNGRDGLAGVRYINLFGALCHGPLLPKNPALADVILTTALQRRYPDAALSPLDDGFEDRARDYMLSRLNVK